MKLWFIILGINLFHVFLVPPADALIWPSKKIVERPRTPSPPPRGLYATELYDPKNLPPGAVNPSFRHERGRQHAMMNRDRYERGELTISRPLPQVVLPPRIPGQGFHNGEPILARARTPSPVLVASLRRPAPPIPGVIGGLARPPPPPIPLARGSSPHSFGAAEARPLKSAPPPIAPKPRMPPPIAPKPKMKNEGPPPPVDYWSQLYSLKARKLQL